MTDFELKNAVQELKDRAEIHDVMVRFCRGVDRYDHALALSAYHDDATDNHGSFDGSAKEFTSWVIALELEQFVWTSHYITNHYSEINGDQANAETYVQVIMRFRRDGKLFDVVACGRYLDKLARRNGEWRISKRVVVGDWDRIEEVKEQVAAELVTKLIRGRRDKQDPSYDYFPSRN